MSTRKKNILSKIIMTALVAVFSFTNSSAQKQASISLEGTVYDESNGEKLIGATITAKLATDSAQMYTTASNSYGYYNLIIPQGAYSLTVSYLGYTTITEAATNSQTKKHGMEIATSELDEVEIYTKRSVRTTEMSTHKLDIATVKKVPAVFGEVDILKVLQLLPGVNTSGDNTTGFSVRGGATDQNLVLIDEAPVYNTAHAFGLFSVFNGDAVKDFKLYKGGIPARYGGRLSSVLDVRQYDGNNRKIQLNGGVGLISAKLSLQGPLLKKKGEETSDNTFFLAARRTYFDIFIPLVAPSGNQNNIIFFHDINGKINLRLGKKDRLFISGYYGYDFFSLENVVSSGWGNTAATIRWNHIYSPKLSSNVSAVYSYYDYQINNDLPRQGFVWKGSIENFFLKGIWDYKVNHKQSFAFGFNSNLIVGNPGVITPNADNNSLIKLDLHNEQGIETALFIEAKRKIGKSLSIEAGLRLNWFGRFGPSQIRRYEEDKPVLYNSTIGIYQRNTHERTDEYRALDLFYTDINIAPRLNVNYTLNNDMSLKFSYNRMVQYLQILSVNTSAIPTDVYRLAGDYVKPATADQVALGYVYNISGKKYPLELSIEGFYKIFSNMTEYINGAELIRNNNIETELLDAKGYAYGLEFMLAKKYGKLTGWVSYTYSSSIRQGVDTRLGGLGVNKGLEFPATSDIPHNLAITATYTFSKRLYASATFTYKSGRPITFPSSKFDYAPTASFQDNTLAQVFLSREIIQYENRNASRLPDYHRLDFSMTYEGKQRKRYKHKWVLSIFNVYGRENPVSIFFTSRDNVSDGLKARQISLFGIIPSIAWHFTIK